MDGQGLCHGKEGDFIFDSAWMADGPSKGEGFRLGLLLLLCEYGTEIGFTTRLSEPFMGKLMLGEMEAR
jgi:hypothetical protein